MASLGKSELSVFLEDSCGPQEYSENRNHRRNGEENVRTAKGPADRWSSHLYYGLCDLGQVISPLCASASSPVNGDL